MTACVAIGLGCYCILGDTYTLLFGDVLVKFCQRPLRRESDNIDHLRVHLRSGFDFRHESSARNSFETAQLQRLYLYHHECGSS